MGYEDAVLMMANRVYNVQPTPMMKKKAYHEFCKLIRLGVIDKISWIHDESQSYKIGTRYNRIIALAQNISIDRHDFVRVVDKTNAVTL